MVETIGMSGLIDTDILIDAMRGLPDAVAFVSALQTAGGVQISVVSAMELTVTPAVGTCMIASCSLGSKSSPT